MRAEGDGVKVDVEGVRGELKGEPVLEVVVKLDSELEKRLFSMAYYLLDYAEYRIQTQDYGDSLRIIGRESEIYRFLRDIAEKIKELAIAERRAIQR